MPFARPSLSELIARVRADIDTRLPGADSRLRHSVLAVISSGLAGLAAGLYSFLEYGFRQSLPDTADGDWLSRHAAVWDEPRKAATACTAQIDIAGLDGSAVPIGTELQRSDGVRYRVTVAATIAAGVAVVPVEAIEPGLNASVDVGAGLTFTSPVPGVQATATVANATPGADEEDDEALRGRVLERIRKPPAGGAAHDYVRWAKQQPGVTRAWCYPGWLGAGTVGLAFVMDGRANVLPLAGDVAAVQAALDVERPVTAALTVFSPAPHAVTVTVDLSPDTPAIRAAVSAELADFFAREAAPGGTLHPSRISEAVSLAEGEFSHVLVQPAAPVVAPAGALPVLTLVFV